ncbi:hypothetical protein [Cryobacterium psychrophilum]|uniref:IPT/TIG domain-containing protein n=1 Tax=Cryobacterium psychrophilum TaxID=41988 RepID=A0A4Y8KPA7_9MICO|nr:hypothetical protein [Cryobacterium psychrophilum]TDW31141.1 hypothetical protein EDD25_2937 [Cryobacterium psychrophilum]TFD78562.1 hypothetical protein E3T53_10295 [Cryobacterium psychrophilum]
MSTNFGRRACLLTVAAGAALLAACAGSPAGAPAGSTTGSSSADPGADSAEQLPGPISPDDPGADVAAPPSWLPIGPAGPADPAPDMWYSRLQNKDCPGLADLNPDTSQLWTAAFTLCAAVVSQDAGDWQVGAEQLAAVSRPGPSDCLERATYDTLTALVAFRTTHPGTRINPASPQTLACALELTGLSTLGGTQTDTGPVCTSGGASIRLLGRLVSVTTVTVGARSVPAEQQAENTVFFVAPPADAPGTVSVTVGDAAGRFPGSATLQYTSDSGLAVDGPCSSSGTSPDAPSNPDQPSDTNMNTDPPSSTNPDPSSDAPVGTSTSSAGWG